ncbi:MAG: BamA/TamA family outer membrane protein [Gemmatimonadaceae bacterium]
MRSGPLMLRLTLALMLVTSVVGSQQPDSLRLSQMQARAVPREVIEELARIYNAPGTLRVGGSYNIESSRVVDSDVAVLDGPLTIAGHVRGRVVAINGSVFLEPGARINGDVLVVGGRLEGREEANVQGDIRVYASSVAYQREGTVLVVREYSDELDDADVRWWRSRERWSTRGWSDIRLLSARTYNRVEGLPMLIGPSVGRDLGWGRVRLDALGIVRTVGNLDRAEHTFGHNVKLEFELGGNSGLRFGGRLFDRVDPVEDWHLTDSEVGLATFFLHRDYRDYFNRHGGSMYAGLYLTPAADITVSFSDQRWAARDARDPFTLFRNSDGWRENPAMDDGSLHVLSGTLRFDTRNDEDDPWSGWYVTADVEQGHGTLVTLGPTSVATRSVTPGPVDYTRGFLDIRRYNRLSPDGQLNLRVVLGGWLSGDPLPLQRRVSVGGPGSLPGYDFRRVSDATDVLTCSTIDPALPGGAMSRAILGAPAQCDRVTLAQIEFRGDLSLDPFGMFDDDWRPWRPGYGRGAQWVLFADAGRGWLVTAASDVADLTYPKNKLPKASTFRTDVGIGLMFENVGFYVAKALAGKDAPVNFFVRLKPRI